VLGERLGQILAAHDHAVAAEVQVLRVEGEDDLGDVERLRAARRPFTRTRRRLDDDRAVEQRVAEHRPVAVARIARPFEIETVQVEDPAGRGRGREALEAAHADEVPGLGQTRQAPPGLPEGP